jgi:pyruvate,water dikinase
MIPLSACVGRADVGRKAETLARLAAAGLPVLDGAVIFADEPIEEAALLSELARLGGEAFAVRSSSPVEDVAGATAAGVFESVIGARGESGVEAAIAEVRSSATGEPARAYLSAHGLEPAPMAVLIQPLARAERLAVAFSGDDHFLVEERRFGDPEWGDVEAHRVARDDSGPLATLLRAIESELGGPVDVELARSGDALTVLQARPLRRAPAVEIDAIFRVPGSWRRDAEHNPQPLSTAQAGLVAHVEALGVGRRQLVLGGYLFVERAPGRSLAPIPVGELARRFTDEVAPDCAAQLAAVEGEASLASALSAYAHVYRRYVAEVGPALARARTELDQLLRMNLGEPLARHGALLGGLGGQTVERDQLLWQIGRLADDDERRRALLDEHRARFGASAPAWDVAVPPDDEAEARVLAVAAGLARDPRSPSERHELALARADEAAHALLERLDRMARRAFKALLARAREALPIAEDDDLLFFRAQRAVRRALVRLGRRLVARGALDDQDQIFELPLPLSEQLDEGAEPDPSLRAIAARERAAQERALRLTPPDAIDDGEPRHLRPHGRAILRGHPTAGHARGRAVIVRSLAGAPTTLPPDAILVVPAILPSLTYLLPAARALVTDHGGATSHGATLAREYGVPAVLGTGRATSLTDGAELYVDATSGRVYLL